ncbi:MAG: hypothetical protein P4L46_21450 [Fimbriimonas sp.]|nr:hypothetical protein [Fimbriimonas sp.]
MRRVANPAEARRFIDRIGMVTHYGASTEVPNLYDAYMSEPNAKLDSSWDSPSGHVYTWRWDLGKASAAFYGALVAKKPTWIAWGVLPSVLGFAMERRHPEDLYRDGLMSNDAIRVVRAFEGTAGVLSTKELRNRAGFPTGKSERAAYLKAVEELDTRLMLAKIFDAESEGDDMRHALISVRYADRVSEAVRATPEEALETFLARYLQQVAFLAPKVLAKNLRLAPAVMEVAADRLIGSGRAEMVEGALATTESEPVE